MARMWVHGLDVACFTGVVWGVFSLVTRVRNVAGCVTWFGGGVRMDLLQSLRSLLPLLRPVLCLVYQVICRVLRVRCQSTLKLWPYHSPFAVKEVPAESLPAAAAPAGVGSSMYLEVTAIQEF